MALQLASISEEPPPCSIVVQHGAKGTAWQRFVSDGMWHSTTGDVLAWPTLFMFNTRVHIVYVPEEG